MEKEKKSEFVVTDRRKFNANGEPRPDVPVDPKPEVTATATNSTAAQAPAAEPVLPKSEPVAVPQQPKTAFVPEPVRETGYSADKERSQFGGQKMEFIHLLDMLVQTAMLYAGGMETGTERQVDVVGLRQMIDLIGLLEEKTKGNLTEQEAGILTNTLFQLRMSYMEIVNMIDRQAMQKMQGAPGAPQK